MSLRTDMVDLILENEMHKEKLLEAQRLLNQVLREPTPEPRKYMLDEYYTIGQTPSGNLKLVRTRSSYYADLRIKTEIGRYGIRTLISVEALER
jgi:hypothetical protein